MDRYLKTSEVAELLGIDPKRVRDLIHVGSLRAIDVGTNRRQYRIRPADLKRYTNKVSKKR